MAKTTGTLPGTYTIKIEPGTKGVAHPVRRQPATLRRKVEEKLKEMERDGHLARVEETHRVGQLNGSVAQKG